MLQISLQNSGGKVVFSGAVPWNPPWAPTGVKVPWSLNPKTAGGGIRPPPSTFFVIYQPVVIFSP